MVSYEVERRCSPLCSLHSLKCAHTSPWESEGGTHVNRSNVSDLANTGAHPLVCREGGHAETFQSCSNLCWSKTAQRECTMWISPMIPKVDGMLVKVAREKFFSKLEAKSEFWQIPLARELRLLTTSIMLFGRYYSNRLPLGILCASELFQCLYYEHDPWGARGNDLSHGHCVGVWINQVEHDTCLWAVMKGLEAAVVTLNSDKCEFGSSQRTTISMKWLCVGGSSQEQEFAQIKAELSQPTVLALYSPKPPTKLSAVALS